jgi:hypothetical protein
MRAIKRKGTLRVSIDFMREFSTPEFVTARESSGEIFAAAHLGD